MALSFGDILKITMFWEQAGNEAVSVGYFRYLAAVTAPNYAQLAEAFGILNMANNSLGNIIHSSAKLARVVVDNASNGLEFGEAIVDLVGLDGGSGPEPAFVAALLKQARETKLTRNGYKRFPFLSESYVQGNNFVPPSGSLAAIYGIWGSEHDYVTVTETGAVEFTMQPVIVGRTLVGGVYEPDLLKINEITEAVFLRATSQNSRKPSG